MDLTDGIPIKHWYELEPEVQTVAWSDQQLTPLSSGDLPWTPENALDKTPALDDKLAQIQQDKIRHLLVTFPQLFSITPGRTQTHTHRDMSVG